jgi:hypothetical protein
VRYKFNLSLKEIVKMYDGSIVVNVSDLLSKAENLSCNGHEVVKLKLETDGYDGELRFEAYDEVEDSVVDYGGIPEVDSNM